LFATNASLSLVGANLYSSFSSVQSTHDEVVSCPRYARRHGARCRRNPRNQVSSTTKVIPDASRYCRHE
jgi:hypothetical protein